MTTNEGLTSLRSIVAAALLGTIGTGLAWLCFQVTVSEVASPSSAVMAKVAPQDPDVVLSRASAELGRGQGVIDAATLEAVRRAAIAAPLDARPYMVLAAQRRLAGQPAEAQALLEAAQRLDPRLPFIHLMLIDRYLRIGDFAHLTDQLSVLARLMSQTQVSVTTALAEMSLAPEAEAAARKTLNADHDLERAVLAELARSDTAPQTIFALASPAARAGAGGKDQWGPLLVARLVAQGRFSAARAVWRKIYGIGKVAGEAFVFNGDFRPTSASPPFNWKLASGSVGSADLKNNSLTVDYYGRDDGELASQLLVLPPGRYRFSFTIDQGKSDPATQLAWSLTCVGGGPALLIVPIAAGNIARRVAADFAIPAGCRAQKLVLRGEAGEFPVPANVTIRGLGVTRTAQP